MRIASATELSSELRAQSVFKVATKCSHGCLRNCLAIRTSIVAMERSNAGDFLDGILESLMPSMLVVAWLAWRATPKDLNFSRGADQQLY